VMGEADDADLLDQVVGSICEALKRAPAMA
jgi:hypothetical protein